ncbi:Ger(x)C family spore germination protein [Neobacillus mesonae]|nr:Ger(x)C family spore germination protein [Neobacillus mesonae]
MRKKTRIYTIFLMALSFALLFSGCGFKDIDNRFFVTSIGLDKGENKKYKVSLKVAINSTQTEPGSSNFQVISSEGDTIAETIRLMKSNVDKEFDFGHAKTLILGKELTNENLNQTLDWAYRRRDIQQITYMAIGEPDAHSVLEFKVKSEREAGNALVLSLSKDGTESPYIVSQYLFDFHRRMRNPGIDAFLPIVKASKDKYDINRTAVVRNENIYLTLSPSETGILNQLVRGFHRFALRSELNGQAIVMNVERMNIKYKILTPPNQKPLIQVQVKAAGEAEESYGNLFDESWAEVNKAFSKKVEEDYTKLLKKLQQNNVDPIGFGLRYYATRHHGHREEQEWKELYPQVEFSVHADVKMQGSGIIK